MILATAFLALAAALGQAAPPARAAPPPTGRLVSRSHLFGLPDGSTGYVPASAGLHPPLLVLLQGVGHRQTAMVHHFQAEADKRGIVLLAPDARGADWDEILIRRDPPSVDSPLGNKQLQRFRNSADAKRVDAAIASLEKIVPVDTSKVALGGFSDGASFALAMGMSRDEPFIAVFGWSPGIAIENANPARGRRVYITHGRQDRVLKFDVTCSQIVPVLQQEGAVVTFIPFNGDHELPQPVMDATLDAVFGPAPGSQAVPLPPQATTCRGEPPAMPDMPH